MKKILITGGAGYIGSVLTKKLLERDYAVRVLDCLRNGGNSLLPFFSNPKFHFIKGNLRRDEVRRAALKNMDAVIHLAAIVGDPACKKNPRLAEEINWRASKDLFDCSNDMGVKKFIFASTCSNYGKMSDPDKYIDETGSLNPVSLYAKLKIRCEDYFLHAPARGMSVTLLRFATAYGVSARMRFDLTVNEFIKEAVLNRELVVFGEQFWRPYCHTEDLSTACIYVLQADRGAVDKEVFNVGDTGENYQKQMLIELIRKHIPQIKVRFVYKKEDPRDYRVNFDKIQKRLKFKITKKVNDGIKEVMGLLRSGVIEDPDSREYKNE